MRQRCAVHLLTFALLGGVLATAPAGAQTRYDYGGGRSGSAGAGEGGFFAELEGGLANPRDADNVVAAVGPNVIIPEWDDDLALRLGLGWQFGDGSRIVLGGWHFETDQDAEGSGPADAFEFPIGPTSGSSFDVTTEVEARTIDAAWIIPQEVSDAFSMEWSAGLRWAYFEETTDGAYVTTGGTRAVDKSNEGDMLGARVAGRAAYRLGSFSASAGVGLSLLDGEIESRSSLTPQPPATVPFELTDDSRSGTILDLDVRATWYGVDDRLGLWLGWEQQVWEDIAADLARNLPGSGVPARDRDTVRFSWVKLGVSFRF